MKNPVFTFGAILLAAMITMASLSPIDQQYNPTINLLENPGFENGLASWEFTGSSTLAKETLPANIYVGKASATWDASASGEFLRSRIADSVVPAGLDANSCVLSFWYLWETGTATHIDVRVHDGTSAVSSDLELQPTTGEWAFATISFTCPSEGDTIRAEFESTADAAALTVDQFVLGNEGASIPDATPSVAGKVSTGTQTFGGQKTFQGVVGISDGTIAAPGLAASGDFGLGLFRDSGNDLMGGSDDSNAVFYWGYSSSRQRFLIGGTPTIYGPFGAGGWSPEAQVSNGSNTNGLVIVRPAADATGATMLLAGRNGAALNDDVLGRLLFVAHDGTDYLNDAAYIQAVANQNAAANDTPSRLDFFTTPDGTNVAVRNGTISDTGDAQWKIDGAGICGIGDLCAHGDLSKTCSGDVNVTSCTANMNYHRNGDVVSAMVQGVVDPSTGGSNIVFTITDMPQMSGTFPNGAQTGTCIQDSNVASNTNRSGFISKKNGTDDVQVAINAAHDDGGNHGYTCSFVYHIN